MAKHCPKVFVAVEFDVDAAACTLNNTRDSTDGGDNSFQNKSWGMERQRRKQKMTSSQAQQPSEVDHAIEEKIKTKEQHQGFQRGPPP